MISHISQKDFESTISIRINSSLVGQEEGFDDCGGAKTANR